MSMESRPSTHKHPESQDELCFEIVYGNELNSRIAPNIYTELDIGHFPGSDKLPTLLYKNSEEEGVSIESSVILPDYVDSITLQRVTSAHLQNAEFNPDQPSYTIVKEDTTYCGGDMIGLFHNPETRELTLRANFTASIDTPSTRDIFDLIQNTAEIWAEYFNDLLDSSRLHQASLKVDPLAHIPIERDIKHEETVYKRPPLDRVGGNFAAKTELEKLIPLITSSKAERDIYDISVPPILIYGPSGTGKTSLIEAFIEQAGATGISIDSSNIIGSYIGSSTKNIVDIFSDASYKAEENPNKPHILHIKDFHLLVDPTMIAGASERKNAAEYLLQRIKEAREYENLIIIAEVDSTSYQIDSEIAGGELFHPIKVSKPSQVELADIFLAQLAVKGWSSVEEDSIYDSDIDMLELAKQCQNLTGSDIECILDQARLNAFADYKATGEHKIITQSDILDSIHQYRSRQSR